MLLDDGFHVSVRRLTNYPNVLSVDYIRGPVESYTRFYLLALLHRHERRRAVRGAVLLL